MVFVCCLFVFLSLCLSLFLPFCLSVFTAAGGPGWSAGGVRRVSTRGGKRRLLGRGVDPQLGGERRVNFPVLLSRMYIWQAEQLGSTSVRLARMGVNSSEQ